MEQNCLPVAGDRLQGAVVSTQGNVESGDGLASLNQVKILLVNTCELGSLIVEELDLLQETRLLICIKLGAKLLGSGEATKD